MFILVPPRIQIDPPLQTVRPGDAAFIDCAAFDDGHSVTITWSRIGGELPTGVTIEAATNTATRINFQGILLTDAGKYLCTVVNAAGRVEALAEIIVDEEIINNISEENAIIGANIDLKCPTEFAEPELYIEWQFENLETFPDNVKIIHNELQIRNAEQNNFGRYICFVNWNGSTIEENIIILSLKGIQY